MKCLRPIVAILPIGSWLCPKCSGQRRVRSRDFVLFNAFFCFPLVFCSALHEMRRICFHVLGFSQKKIIDFFRIQKCGDAKHQCASPQGKIVGDGDNVDSHRLCLHLFERFMKQTPPFRGGELK